MRNLKKVLALVLAMAMSLSLAVTAGAAYKDGDKISDKYDVAVEFASQLGILEGFEDNTYRPQGTLTRAQLATMVYRMTTADVDGVYEANFAGGAAENFTDTPATAWYAGAVGYAADAELLKGLGDNTYAPNAPLTGYAALAAFLRGVGYNEPGHNFTGADWTVQVAKVAKDAGVLEGIEGVDLNKAISREVAAQMIYNIMFAGLVEYTPAFGYQSFWTAGDDLASAEFDIISEKDGENANIAPWGRPATIWYENDNGKAGDALVTIAVAPVAEYTTAVTECNLAKDLGLKADGDVSKLYINGKAESRTVEFDSDKEITLTDTKTEIGDQGTLVEIYEVDDKYQVVEIETWLAKATATAKATYDKAGHEVTPATATFNIYGLSTETLETADYAVGDYALVNFSQWNDGDEYKGETYYLTATAPAASGDITAYSLANETSTIGGTVYDWAAKFNLGWNDRLDVNGKTYDVFEDFYGNVIGLIESEIVYTYGIITKMAWADSYMPLDDAKAYANILDFTATADNAVVIDEYLGDPLVGANTTDTVRNPNVSTDAANNAWYYDYAFKFEANSDGSKDVVAMGAGFSGETIEAGTSDFFATAKAGTNDDTVYLVKTGNENDGYKYTSYVGYKNVPSMQNVSGSYFVEDNYVSYMFVDATKAIFTGSDEVAFIFSGDNTGKNGDLYTYDIFVGTKSVEKLHANAALTGFSTAGLYEITYNAEGEILSVAPAAGAYVTDIVGVVACDGTVIENTTESQNITDAAVFLMDTVEEEIIAGDYDDTIGKTAYLLWNDTSKDTVIAIYVLK